MFTSIIFSIRTLVWDISPKKKWYRGDATQHMRTIHGTHMNESCHTYEEVLSHILRSAEYGLFYRALVQKRPIIWRSLLIVMIHVTQHMWTIHFLAEGKVLYQTWLFPKCMQISACKSGVNTYGSFANKPYKRDCILQKRPIFLRSLLIICHSADARRRMVYIQM